MTLSVPREFGYCVLVAVGSVFITVYLSIQVVRARKRFGVEYPTMYDDTKPIFNCYQRAHQNTMEGYPIVMVLMLLGGLQHPHISAICGGLWFFSRIFFAHGYYTGDPPTKKSRGHFGDVAFLGCVGATISLALHLLEYV